MDLDEEREYVVLPCGDLSRALEHLTGSMGFRLDAIYPADDPVTALVSGHGLRIRLQRNETKAATPGECGFVVCESRDENGWTRGRADMQYRDLIPGRQGGRIIASHIRIPEGGPVPDYVHHHSVRFQLIYCHAGRVRVVYEDQGEPFDLWRGDWVLQPPGIRHRVLECSDGLEVIEVACPAAHATWVDHELELPTSRFAPERTFAGQRFVHGRREDARWEPSPLPAFLQCDLVAAAATDGWAEAHVLRSTGERADIPETEDPRLRFLFVIAGSARFHLAGGMHHALAPGDAMVVPARMRHAWRECSRDLELLQVAFPAGLEA